MYKFKNLCFQQFASYFYSKHRGKYPTKKLINFFLDYMMTNTQQWRKNSLKPPVLHSPFAHSPPQKLIQPECPLLPLLQELLPLSKTNCMFAHQSKYSTENAARHATWDSTAMSQRDTIIADN